MFWRLCCGRASAPGEPRRTPATAFLALTRNKGPRQEPVPSDDFGVRRHWRRRRELRSGVFVCYVAIRVPALACCYAVQSLGRDSSVLAMRKMTCTLSVACMWLVGCASSVQLTAHWDRPHYQGAAMKKLAVVALSGEKERRRVIENNILAELAKLGIAGVAGNDVFGELPTRQETAAARQRLESLGVDGAITVRLVSRTVSERAVGPVSADDRYAGDFFASYQTFYEPAIREATVDVDTAVVLECALYKLSEQGPLATRELTVKKGKTLEQVREGVHLLVTSLEEAGFLPNTK